ncbi:outer membrane protein assembly factor BamB family protein [Anatilimnocola floriformis]|uniref:outer membrane protein assembly factor BamB family protein n=1 Tax=Anatilimnocola floriformis TaxID=2948575 RepID=UPI0020C3FF29|nr:PQQ-binding-like beta-propeller repeat protein [Anatilimnocola floriformis]
MRARLLLFAVGILVCTGEMARGQIFPGPTDLATAELQLIDAAGSAHLENARQLLAQKQYDEAVEAIRRVLENDGGRLIKVQRDPRAGQPANQPIWHVPVREYCHWRLAALASEAPEALAAYRRLVDPLAERWLNDGRQQHQPALLRRVIDEAWASRWGDDAAFSLGDEALSRGDLTAARYWWERTGLGFRTPVKGEMSPYYPDSDLPSADVQARLVLVSILNSETERAEAELKRFRAVHTDDEGVIGGRRGKYAELLTAFAEQAKAWPARPSPPLPFTWGGTAERNGIFSAQPAPDPAGKPLWTTPLPRLTSDRDVIGAGRLRVADDMKSLAAYFPLVWKNDVLVRVDSRGDSYLAAFDLTTGALRWRVGNPRGASRMTDPPMDDGTLGEINDVHSDMSRHVGVARYTLTVSGDKAFTRMGSPVTLPRSRRVERLLAKDQGWLLGVDLAAEGKPLSGFPIRPESAEWSFEGAPLIHDGALYVAMRHAEGSRSQIYVACYELSTTFAPLNDDDDDARPTGRLRFRTRIASAAAVGGGNLDEISGLLLTSAHGHIYCNTNAGAIGCVEAASGKVRWVVTYPRSLFRSDDSGDSVFFRDLNPCLAAGDQIIVAPQDCDRIISLDALSGQIRWQTAAGVAADATTLLGVRDNTLIAAGDRVYWIDARSGALLTQYTAGRPDASSAATSPRGLGQGVIVGDQVWWPTRENILIFGTQPARRGNEIAPPLLKEIPLVPRGLTGGNLLVAGDKLLITTGVKLAVFGPQPPVSPPPLPELR